MANLKKLAFGSQILNSCNVRESFYLTLKKFKSSRPWQKAFFCSQTHSQKNPDGAEEILQEYF